MVEEADTDGEKSRAAPDHFSASYDRARRSYGFAVALLLGWELVGIEIPPDPLTSVRIILKSPQAVPYILIALVAYFGFRLTVEWFQAEPKRRGLRASRIDFAVSHALATVALILYLGQAVLHAQIINAIKPMNVGLFALAVLAGMVGAVAADMFATRSRLVRTLITAGPILAFGGVAALWFHQDWVGAYMLGGSVVVVGIVRFISRWSMQDSLRVTYDLDRFWNRKPSSERRRRSGGLRTSARFRIDVTRQPES